MKKQALLIFLILAPLFAAMTTYCTGKTGAWHTMTEAEALMESNPDSALMLLSLIEKSALGDNEEQARYALLMSMALDKNYIDTTSFDVLQPALDYYIIHGSTDEKLRTLYYQGRIFQNKSDLDKAMHCFLTAKEIDNYKDTLTYARLLVAQGQLNYDSYEIHDFILNNLQASRLYGEIGETSFQQSCLLNALNGCTIINDNDKADSILPIADSLLKVVPEYRERLYHIKLNYQIRFNPDNNLKDVLDSITNTATLDNDAKISISFGYLNLNMPQKAKAVFETIDTGTINHNSMSYLLLKTEVLEANEMFREATAALKTYYAANTAENEIIYSNKTSVAHERHRVELDNLYNLQKKNMTIWISICATLVLIIIIIITGFLYHSSKTKRILAEKERCRLSIENVNLQQQKENARLECERQTLANENMSFRISQLEAERDKLKELLKESELSKPILAAIQERIEMLNGLLAAQISDNKSYTKPYDKWISKVTEDRNNFMTSNRLAFRASHPAFMKYLDDHGLNEAELNYVCLYAVGLRGKEVGEYIRLKRHYHISSDIRKKLGLNEDDTNLGIYIKKLMKIT